MMIEIPILSAVLFIGAMICFILFAYGRGFRAGAKYSVEEIERLCYPGPEQEYYVIKRESEW